MDRIERLDKDVTQTAKQHTLGHLLCPACLELKTVLICSITPEMKFSEASSLWLESRAVDATPGALTARYIRKRTETSYKQYVSSLNLFFGEMRLRDIEWVHFRAYQRARLAGDAPFLRRKRPQDEQPSPSPAGARKTNYELDMLKRIMKRARVWNDAHEEMHESLIVEESDVPRALTPKDQRIWLDMSRMKPRWMVVHWYSILAFETCMSTNEIRGLRLGDINMHQRVITVPRKAAKNRYRARTIPLVNADVLWAVEQLILRAQDCGARDPQHYLFPWRCGASEFDPSRPMSESGIKKPWEEVRKATGLLWFRQYDCRHTAISRLAEAGTPVDVIMSMAGHVSEKMRQHYTHVSEQSKIHYLQHAYRMRHPAQPDYRA